MSDAHKAGAGADRHRRDLRPLTVADPSHMDARSRRWPSSN